MFCRVLILAGIFLAGCGDVDKRSENVNAGFAGQFQVSAVQSESSVDDSSATASCDPLECSVE